MNQENLSYFKSFLETPPLWSGQFDGLSQFVFPDIDFSSLNIKSIPPHLRLGHKIEHIFLQLIQHSEQFKLIGHNIAIRRNKISLGEIDFIIQNTDSPIYTHIELTYKFYLLRKEKSAVEYNLIGPNKKDSFYLKKEKIKNRQIPLLKTPEAIKALKAHGIALNDISHRVCFKSQIFIPFSDHSVALAPFNTQCIAGKYLTYREFDSMPFASSHYYIPSKQEWLLTPHDQVPWLTFNQVLQEMTNKRSNNISTLLWVRGYKPEIEKLFLVWW